MRATLSVTVLISIMGCVELIIVETPQKFVNVTRGESVSLKCNFTTLPKKTSLTIRWNFVPTSSITKQVYYYNAESLEKEVIPESYRGRLQPPSDPSTTKDASIMINNMRPSDDGVYICEVHNFPDVIETSNITVHVLAPSCAPPPPHLHQGKGPRFYGAGILIGILIGIFLLS